MDDATTQTLKVWDALASGWDSTRKDLDVRERPVTERMHAAVAARPGDTILELCAGPGEVGLQLAEKHPDVHVIVSDFAPGMIRAAEAEAVRRGIGNAETRLIDAQNIDLPDASVDGVVCRYGLMLVPDVPRAFSEVRRVLRAGRPLVYTTWAPLEANPWMAIFGAVMVQRGHFTPPEGGGFMPLGGVDDNVATARAAGFDHVDAELVDLPQRFAGFDGYWNIQRELAGPLATILKGLPPDEVAAVRAHVEEFAKPFSTGDELTFPSRRVFVVAR